MSLFRFRIRTLMIVVAIVAIECGLFVTIPFAGLARRNEAPMRQPRFTTRRLMVLVAVAAAVLGLMVHVEQTLLNDEKAAYVLAVMTFTSMFVGTIGFTVVLLLSLLIKIGDAVLNKRGGPR